MSPLLEQVQFVVFETFESAFPNIALEIMRVLVNNTLRIINSGFLGLPKSLYKSS